MFENHIHHSIDLFDLNSSLFYFLKCVCVYIQTQIAIITIAITVALI